MHVRQRLGASERHACHVLGQPRSTQRRVKKVRVDESALRTDVIRLASRFGRYGYRQITNLLRIEGWEVNHKRVERIWRQEGLKVPRRQRTDVGHVIEPVAGLIVQVLVRREGSAIEEARTRT